MFCICPGILACRLFNNSFRLLVDDDIDSIDSESVRSFALIFLFKDVSRSLRLPKLFSTLSESPFTAVRIGLVHSLSC